MRRNIILSMLLGAVIFSPSAFAQRTQSYVMAGAVEETKTVVTNGGVINVNINPDTGLLSGTLNPGFTVSTNAGGDKFLTMSVAANTQSGMQNAIYNDGSLAYVILTNTDALPPVSSLTNIKTLAPTAVNNPNAIAYHIIDPPNQMGVLETEFEPSSNTWKLHLSKQGPVNTEIAIPAALPYTNTFSGDDDAGRYQATVTLSFD